MGILACLKFVQPGIDSLFFDEITVRAAFGYSALVDHENAVGHPDGRESVADDDGGFSTRELVELPENLVFGFDVE